jgi:OmpA-OmpF porin, OOP family
MRSSNTPFKLIALAFALALSGAVFGQDSNASSLPGDASNTTQTRTVVDGKPLKIEGIVIKRDSGTFALRDSDDKETVVVLTDKTTFRKVRKGWFHPDKTSSASKIVRGLRLKADGRGNADGQLVASEIRFDEEDLWAAQALASRVDPVETLSNSTQALAQSNQQRISEAEQNAQRISGQVDELTSMSTAALASAQSAQASADQAQSDANNANQRISGLDNFDVVNTAAVYFRPGSAVLLPEAKTVLDEAAAQVQSENLKGWVIEVAGYADSTGKTAKNRSLSEQRADAVIDYMVTKYNFPMRRMVQPFGYGSLNPVASNNTREGRAENRRVEIRVLVNNGISSQSASQQTANEDSQSRQP